MKWFAVDIPRWAYTPLCIRGQDRSGWEGEEMIRFRPMSKRKMYVNALQPRTPSQNRIFVFTTPCQNQHKSRISKGKRVQTTVKVDILVREISWSIWSTADQRPKLFQTNLFPFRPQCILVFSFFNGK